MTEMTFRVNKSSTDKSYAAMVSGEDLYEDVAINDLLIFSAGSADVIDGGAIPDSTKLNRAATLLSATLPTVVAKYFLADTSVSLLKEIHLAGRQNKQYVFCCSFDGATASEPILEAWDNDSMDTTDLICLGNGVPSLSWYKAICTTSALPGASWTGTALAGSGASNSVLLNNGSGALTVATDLYFNFYVLIPAGVTTPATENPVLVITYTTN